MKMVRTLTDCAEFVIGRLLPLLCSAMLGAMVVFIAYTVAMRTIFLNPPFWGDTLATFANVWMVFLGAIIAVRERSNISMEALYRKLPDIYTHFLRRLWLVGFMALGALLFVFGLEAARRIPGFYWELGNLPKSYPLMILPVSGIGIGVAAIIAFMRYQRDDA